MGHDHPGAQGRLEVIVYAGLDPLTGKQRQLTWPVNDSLPTAKQVETELRAEVTDGRQAGTTALLGELVDLWLRRRADSGKPISPHTLDDYRGLIAGKIKPALGRTRLRQVTPQVLDGFYDQLRERGNANAATRARQRARATAAANGEDPAVAAAGAKPTAADRRLSANRVRDVHVILAGALRLAARWGLIPFNPALLARPPSGSTGARRPVPSYGQVTELLAATANQPEFAVLLRLSATAGLRPGELCALRWADVDLDAMTVEVNGAIVTSKHLPDHYLRNPPKSRHSERRLALDATTTAMLRDHRDRCDDLAEHVDAELSPAWYVFARTPDGALPMRLDAVGKRFAAVARRLGHGYRLYGLRHFMATQLGAVAGAGTIRDRMGHGSLAVTSRYLHRVSEADRAAAQDMGDLLDGQAAWEPPTSLHQRWIGWTPASIRAGTATMSDFPAGVPDGCAAVG
jgi:integrase